MGGEPVTAEPAVLVVDEDVRSILEEAGLLSFFKKFGGHSENVTNQFVETWKDGRVVVSDTKILVNEALIAKVSGLSNEGEVISRDKMNQVSQLTKFIKDGETFCWMDSGIARESLPKPWDRVAVQINIPLFLFKSLEKSLHAVKVGKGKVPLHQKLIVDFALNRKKSAAGPSKGGFTRISGAPISKVQLLLGPVPTTPHIDSEDSETDAEGDSESLEKDSPTKNPKDKGSRKRKPPAQVLKSSEEDRKSEDAGTLGGRSSPPKVLAVAPSGSAKCPGDSLSLSEELRCHLRVLNGLGGSLTSTCACINLLTLEITNYLKEVGTNIIRLHIDGVVVGEKSVAYASQKGVTEDTIRPLNLLGIDSSSNGVQGYAHYVRLLAQPAVTNHYVKNPPLELALDGSSGAPDDHEVEESGDGIWSVVGGKASCRRNFALDVVLLDALGRSIHKDMELIALLVYADNGAPVEKPKDDAEAPLLTTFDGVEFPSTERPIRLVHGRASFKLKISQLSSKCDNRLFRVCFDSPNTPSYPFLRVFSRPIRCVSRNRNSRTPSVPWKKSNSAAYQLDATRSPGPDETMLESPQTNGDNLVHGPVSHGLKFMPPLKRVRVGHEKHSVRIGNGSGLSEQSSDAGGNSYNLNGNDISTPSPSELNKVIPAASPLGTAHPHTGNAYFGLSAASPLNLHQADPVSSEAKLEKLQEGNSLPSEGENIHARKSAAMRLGASEGAFSDYFVFKYCLESMYNRSTFLKGAIMCRSDQDVADFAARVSQYTGCHHNGYQILIAKQLIQEGSDLWKLVSRDIYPLPWNNVIQQMEKKFMMISRCTKRQFSAQDKEFLRRIAGCSETVVREAFDRLWQWLFPVALALSNPQIQTAWESIDPKWIEGMISREEVEVLLRTSEKFPKPGTFILRFPISRSWPHPDAGALIVSYVGPDYGIHHRLLSLDERYILSYLLITGV
eukprot:Gb_27439 [translate_table: standard]